MRKSRRKFSQRNQPVTLLFDTSSFTDPVGHRANQPRGQLRHFLYKLRELRGGKTQEAPLADCSPRHRSSFHPGKGKKPSHIAGLERKSKRLTIDFAARLEFSSKDYKHIFRRITLADICIARLE